MMLIAVTAVGQEFPGQESINRAAEALTRVQPDLSLSLVERAWQQLRDAGPLHPGYRDGVNAVARALGTLGRPMRAETLYEQAIAAAHDFQKLERDLRIMQAEFLRSRGKQVAAELLWERLMPTQRAAESILLASLKKELGKLAEAEALYRRAIEQPATEMGEWLLPTSHTDLEIFDAENAFADFLDGIGRVEDAKQVRPPKPVAVESKTGPVEPDRKTEPDSKMEEPSFLRGPIVTYQSLSFAEVLLFSPPEPDKIGPAIERGDFDGALPHVLAKLSAVSGSGPLGTDFAEIASRFGEADRTADLRLILERYLAASERVHGSGSAQNIKVMKECIERLALAGLPDEARHLLYRVESDTLLHAGAQSPEMEDVLAGHAHILDAEGKTEDAAKKYREWLDLRIALHGTTSASVVEAHRRIAEFHADAANHDEARSEWIAAVEASRTLWAAYGTAHAELVSAAAEYFKSCGDKELAERFESEARRATPESSGSQHLSRAVIPGSAHDAAAGVRAAAA